LPTEIPDKGRVLTGLSGFWFSRTKSIVPNHLLTIRDDGRTMECRRLLMLPIECVVRGYLSGSGWKSYRESRDVCGIAIPEGLRGVARLGQDPTRPRAPRRGGRRHACALHRSVRADHEAALRRLRGRSREGPRMKATVLVRPKPGILDPQGKAVEDSLRHLGFKVDEARVGRLLDLEVETNDPDQARAEVERMCAELLANPLIESYEIELSEKA